MKIKLVTDQHGIIVTELLDVISEFKSLILRVSWLEGRSFAAANRLFVSSNNNYYYSHQITQYIFSIS